MIFIDACKRVKTPYTPIWFMRQAGRYLEEYKRVRSQAGSFLDLCHNPELACEVTLQPIDILDVDAAILFSDILVLPNEMGLDLQFLQNEGPKFSTTIRDEKSFLSIKDNAFLKLNYVYDTISLIRKQLDKSKALIGFSGAPWTLATYMIEGEGSKSYAHSKKLLYSNKSLMHKILEKLSFEILQYLDMQIKSGVDAVMIFDSWALALEEEAYLEFGLSYIDKISAELKRLHPNTPIIIFPRAANIDFAKISGNYDVVSVDYGHNLAEIKSKIGNKYVLQGNLEPARIYNYASMEKGVEEIISIMKNDGHIFNLGHGMLPDLPLANAKALVQMIREKSSKF